VIDFPADCYNHFGKILIRDCDDGRPFFFIESGGLLYDVYYADGISFAVRAQVFRYLKESEFI